MDIFSVIALLGGLTFFLFGMSVMSDSLEKLAGSKLESLLQQMTSSPLRGLLLGTAITMAIQSSSATTVMLVGLVNSGIMQLAQTVEVIFGANIGTTITAWILSLSGIEGDMFFIKMLKPINFAPVLAFVGIVFRMMSKSERKHIVGTIFIGFAVLIFGMEMMAGAVEPLADSPEFASILIKFKNPVLGILFGAIFTAVVQSSSASVGILQALALSSVIPIGTAIPIIMGQNIGTCITALLSAIGANTNAKRVAVVHLTIKVIGSAVFLPLFILVNALSPALFDGRVSVAGIAIIHTIFNILNTVLLIGAKKFLLTIAEKLVREKEKTVESSADILYLDERLLISPPTALIACDNAANRMAELAQASVGMAITTLDTVVDDCGTDISVQASVIKNTENETDQFEDTLGTYLVKLSGQSLSDHDAQIVAKMLHVINDMERLGDHALSLSEAALEISEKKMTFTPDATAELKNLSCAIEEILDVTFKAYLNNDSAIASDVEPLEQVIDRLIANLRKGHITRLQHGQCTIEAGFVLNDILNNYERISDHCSNVAVAVIEAKMSSFDTHKYLNELKYGDADFKTKFESYAKKYTI